MKFLVVVKIEAESKDEAMKLPAQLDELRAVFTDLLKIGAVPPTTEIRYLLVPGRWA